MPEITTAHFGRMQRAYRPEIAEFLASYALQQQVLTYGDLAVKFGGVARAFGDRLGGVTILCRGNNLPLLPVIVVNKATGRPSEDAALYRDMGLTSDELVRAEQKRCFDFDWTSISF